MLANKIMNKISLLIGAILLYCTQMAYAGEITVSAAASLTNAFKEIAVAYENEFKNDKVLLNFGGSGALLQQMSKGAPVDIFASADEETMDKAEKQGLILKKDRHDFVSNTLVLIVPIDHSLVLKNLNDLILLNKIAIGNFSYVPVGKYTKYALEKEGLWLPLQNKFIPAQNVRQVLDYVARKEVDAGFVYLTDALIMKDKVKIVFEVPSDLKIIYPLAQTVNAVDKDAAQRLIKWILSSKGQDILSRYGFKKP